MEDAKLQQLCKIAKSEETKKIEANKAWYQRLRVLAYASKEIGPPLRKWFKYCCPNCGKLLSLRKDSFEWHNWPHNCTYFSCVCDYEYVSIGGTIDN